MVVCHKPLARRVTKHPREGITDGTVFWGLIEDLMRGLLSSYQVFLLLKSGDVLV
jgi:hypothetical protein